MSESLDGAKEIIDNIVMSDGTGGPDDHVELALALAMVIDHLEGVGDGP